MLNGGARPELWALVVGVTERASVDDRPPLEPGRPNPNKTPKSVIGLSYKARTTHHQF